MRSADDFRAYAARVWTRRLPGWLAAEPGPLTWPLHPPSEREALTDPDAVARWAVEWARLGERPGVEVEWVQRAWASAGRQRLPARVSATPDAASALAGQEDAWRRASEAAALLARGWPETDFGEALRGLARPLSRLAPEDQTRLAAVLGWLDAHPDPGLWERELPVTGVDTKWFERHRMLVEPLAHAITGRGTGLLRRGVGFRVRQLAAGGADFTVTLDELSALPLRPARVLICENLTTVSTLPMLSDTVAIHGMGFAAPSLADIGWVRDADIVYWGDLDTYGLRILGQVRAVLPHTRSVLMNAATLDACMEFAVVEPRPYRGELGYLTVTELELLFRLRDGDLRLEQERIPRDLARAGLVELA